MTAISFLHDTGVPLVFDIPFLLQLHRLVMHALIHESQTGVLRKTPSAIFDGNGTVAYVTPPAAEIPKLLTDLLRFVNEIDETPPLIKAALVHMGFEKIHPFPEGNGRVGRILFQAVLAKYDYHFHWLLSIEELLQERKQAYYTLFGQNDGTAFIEFMLRILFEESEKVRVFIGSLSRREEEDMLLPRRREILAIIRDHDIVAFDHIRRRFINTPPRSLRYDMQQLQKSGFIRKIGTTRGALYQAKKRS